MPPDDFQALAAPAVGDTPAQPIGPLWLVD
jgi:hypothetical protein